MANEEVEEDPPKQQNENEDEQDNLSSSDTDSDSDSDSDSSDSSSDEGGDPTAADLEEKEVPLTYVRPGEEPPDTADMADANIRRFEEILFSRRAKRKKDEEDRKAAYHEDPFNFPPDPENWREEDIGELWADAPVEMLKPGWDPVWADQDDWDVVKKEVAAGNDPPIAPFYLPYRKPYPVIPDNHYDISSPKAVIEELDRTEEFLNWVSYIFPDGSSYEGTVWDDLAHGKGVYIGGEGFVRYEGEWLQNNMEGHGVVYVDIPDIEPIPGSKLEAKMRAEGRIIQRDFMSPEDREWLEKDIEDHVALSEGNWEVPFYENDEWIRQFGKKPEKGWYRYAGQWKQGRMHGCGVYEVNDRIIYGRFYFGEYVDDDEMDCDEDTSALHAGIAEVAAAKAQMFLRKPDGMVREDDGPFNDPQHPYFYEEADAWMAPGFINQFYEVPDDWKVYVDEVDKEREMWLNSFYKAPLRLPMPAELEYWWQQDHVPEFILLNKDPEPDPEDPSRLIYTEDPVILHTPTGRIINYVEDEKYGLRLFWEPPLEEGEEPDPEKVEFLPLGFDEFYGKEEVKKKENLWERLFNKVENAFKPIFESLENWAEEKKKMGEMKMQLIEKELDLMDAEMSLEQAIDEMDDDIEEEIEDDGGESVETENEVRDNAEQKLAMDTQQNEKETSVFSSEQEEKAPVEEEEQDDEEEEDYDDDTPSSFGTVSSDLDPTKSDQKGNKPPFSSLSLSIASLSNVSAVPSRVHQLYTSWMARKLLVKPHSPSTESPIAILDTTGSVSFPVVFSQEGRMKSKSQAQNKFVAKKHTHESNRQLYALSRILSQRADSLKRQKGPTRLQPPKCSWLHAVPERDTDILLSLHMPLYDRESHEDATIP